MIASTVLAVGFVPVFYVVWQNISEFRARRRARAAERSAGATGASEPSPAGT